ncbi:hypothetical protein HDU85_005652 [Gaertneriomyces sp. JEL0708]|nr:hypothetical protein HDU85_005652 [Gaertneriomyces sp. JEL0708]
MFDDLNAGFVVVQDVEAKPLAVPDALGVGTDSGSTCLTKANFVAGVTVYDAFEANDTQATSFVPVTFEDDVTFEPTATVEGDLPSEEACRFLRA